MKTEIKMPQQWLDSSTLVQVRANLRYSVSFLCKEKVRSHLYLLGFAECDLNCASTSGCNTQGGGFCDTLCKSGYGLTSAMKCSRKSVQVCRSLELVLFSS